MASPAHGASAPASRQSWLTPVWSWTLLSCLWLVLSVVSAIQHVAWREVDWGVALGFALMDWGPWLVLSPVVLWYARRVRIDSHNWRLTVPLHVLGGIVVAFASQFLADGLASTGLLPLPEGFGRRPSMVERSEGEHSDDSRDRRPPPPEVDRGPGPRGGARPPIPQFVRARFSIPIYAVLVAAAHAVAYHRRSLERERRALAAEARLAEARLMALQTQLNPHFLFNTLNAISSFVYTQPQTADEMICSLSDLLRIVLANSDRREVTLAEELELVTRYVDIQRLRFADRIEFRSELAAGLDDCTVPTLILQPIVENAVVHGLANNPGRGTLTLKTAQEKDRLVLTVCDTGSGLPLPKRADGTLDVAENVGLGNTRARLEALYGTDAHMTLSVLPEGGVCARLDLPVRHAVAS